MMKWRDVFRTKVLLPVVFIAIVLPPSVTLGVDVLRAGDQSGFILLIKKSLLKCLLRMD